MVGAQNKSRHRVTMTACGWSGEAGIRTLGWREPTPVFKTGAIGRSATSPSDLNSCAKTLCEVRSLFAQSCYPFQLPFSIASQPCRSNRNCEGRRLGNRNTG